MDAAGLTAAEQADCLRALERAEAMHTAARARVLAAFQAGCGFQDDGHGSAKTWLAVADPHHQGRGRRPRWPGCGRLAAHPAVAGALAAGDISPSWARQVCAWTDLLPAGCRAGADAILLAAAAGGADLAGLAQLAEEMRRRTARPDTDGDDGFRDPSMSLDVTFGQAGKPAGDLTPQCAAALSAVLDALGKRAGPEDLRPVWQRRHDALEEACRRLIAAGCVPARAGQPTQIQVHMTLDQLRGLDRGGPGARAAGWPPEGRGADCDAAIVPVVNGHVDHQLLAGLAAQLLGARPGQPGGPGARRPRPARAARAADPAPGRWLRAERAVRQLLIARAADLLSGPGGLASYLRTRLPEDIIASVSLPLDIGAVTDTIPVHLRRAVTVRDPHCRWPGCTHPATACQPHHIIPPRPGRHPLPDQPDRPVHLPPPHRDPPLGLGHHPAPRRDRHRHQPRRPHPPQPQPPATAA